MERRHPACGTGEGSARHQRDWELLPGMVKPAACGADFFAVKAAEAENTAPCSDCAPSRHGHGPITRHADRMAVKP
jgi:hypothetical protein